jgi:hypothetical protein
MASDPTTNDPFEIIDKLHLGCCHAIEQPEIKMLPSVKGKPLAMR